MMRSHSLRRRAALCGLAAALTLAAPAYACDPEDLAREYRSLCSVTHTTLKDMAEALGPSLAADTRTLVLAKAEEAKKLCLDDKYDEGMKLALRATRLLGNAEARQGLPGERFADAGGAPVSLAAKTAELPR